ncbi:MAG: hypothetical protein WBO44_13060, partial [Saprospiraceae bacterium]
RLKPRWAGCSLFEICEKVCLPGPPCFAFKNDKLEQREENCPYGSQKECYIVSIPCFFPRHIGAFKGGNDGDSGNNNNGSSNGSGGSNNNQSNLIDRVNDYDEECGVDLLNDYENIAYGCQEITKGKDMAAFKLCVTEALWKQGAETGDDCLKEYLNIDNDDDLEFIKSLGILEMDDDERPSLCEIEYMLSLGPAARSNLSAIYSNANKASTMTYNKFGRNKVKDCSDAFRHAYWMALNARICGSSFALGYGIAHECKWPDNLVDKVMDLFNNSKGIEYGENNPGLSETQLADLICVYLETGDLKIIKNPDTNNELLVSSLGCDCL